MTIKVALISLGCNKNEIDAELILGVLQQDSRFQITSNIKEANAVIVNTCAFIESAKQESINTLLQICDLKKAPNTSLHCIAVTGCLAERYQQQIKEEIPETDVVLGIGSNQEIANAIYKSITNKIRYDAFAPKSSAMLNGPRILSHPSHFAYIKIAEGCNNRCAYCAIPFIRGAYRSRTMEDIESEALWLYRQGVKELIVIAQDTSYYGKDIYHKPMLAALLKRLCQIDFHWIRVLYVYPERIDDALLDVIKEEKKIVKYLDIPIQHIDSSVLQRMDRHTNQEEIIHLLKHIKEKIPNIVLRTTLIAGFPGETEEEFNALFHFVKKQRFDRLGCFPYSREEGTKAALMSEQIDQEIKLKRAEKIMELQQEILIQKAEPLIGNELEVIIDEYDSFTESYLGRRAADTPEVDCNVYINSKNKLPIGEFINVKITDSSQGDLIGVPI